MNRRWAGILVVGAALVLIVAMLLLREPSRPRALGTAPAPAALSATPGSDLAALPPESRLVTLWLPAASGRIAPLEIEVKSAPEPKARIEALLRALLAARPPAPFAPLFDAPVELAAALRGPGATLYVDLVSKDGAPPPGSGSAFELQRVYALVHTVVRNEPSVERVVLLWNGVQRRSFAGHVDTSRALEPRPELEARASAERTEPVADAPRSQALPEARLGAPLGSRPESDPEPAPESNP